MVFVVRPRLLLETRLVFETRLLLEQMQSDPWLVLGIRLVLEEIRYITFSCQCHCKKVEGNILFTSCLSVCLWVCTWLCTKSLCTQLLYVAWGNFAKFTALEHLGRYILWSDYEVKKLMINVKTRTNVLKNPILWPFCHQRILNDDSLNWFGLLVVLQFLVYKVKR